MGVLHVNMSEALEIYTNGPTRRSGRSQGGVVSSDLQGTKCGVFREPVRWMTEALLRWAQQLHGSLWESPSMAEAAPKGGREP